MCIYIYIILQSTYIITVCVYKYIYIRILVMNYVLDMLANRSLAHWSVAVASCRLSVNFGKKRSGYKIGSASNINHVARKNSTYWEVQGWKNTSSCPININKLFYLRSFAPLVYLAEWKVPTPQKSLGVQTTLFIHLRNPGTKKTVDLQQSPPSEKLVSNPFEL